MQLCVKLFCAVVLFSQINGQATVVPTTLGQFPAQAFVSVPTGLCSGIILNANHILTAANCIFNGQNLMAASAITVRVGIVEMAIATPPHIVTHLFPHHHFNTITMENDVAVLRLSANIQFTSNINNTVLGTAPVVLGTQIIPDASACQGVQILEQGAFMRQAVGVVNTMTQDRCNANVNYAGAVREWMFCGLGPITPACANDRGTVVYCNGTAVGMQTFRRQCVAAVPAAFTQLRVYHMWIQQQFNRSDVMPAGTTPAPGVTLTDGAATEVASVLLLMAAAVTAATIGHWKI